MITTVWAIRRFEGVRRSGTSPSQTRTHKLWHTHTDTQTFPQRHIDTNSHTQTHTQTHRRTYTRTHKWIKQMLVIFYIWHIWLGTAFLEWWCGVKSNQPNLLYYMGTRFDSSCSHRCSPSFSHNVLLIASHTCSTCCLPTDGLPNVSLIVRPKGHGLGRMTINVREAQIMPVAHTYLIMCLITATHTHVALQVNRRTADMIHDVTICLVSVVGKDNIHCGFAIAKLTSLTHYRKL